MFIQHGMFGIENLYPHDGPLMISKPGPGKESVNSLERNLSIQERIPKWGGFEIQLKMAQKRISGGVYMLLCKGVGIRQLFP